MEEKNRIFKRRGNQTIVIRSTMEAAIDLKNIEKQSLYEIECLFKTMGSKEKQIKYQKVRNIVDHLLEALRDAWNVDWYFAKDIIEVLQMVTCSKDKMDMLISIRNSTNMEVEKSHYDWAEEYTPTSPLRCLWNLYESWKQKRYYPDRDKSASSFENFMLL